MHAPSSSGVPPLGLMRSFLALWLVTGIVLLIGSVRTLLGAAHGVPHANPHVGLLAAVEALSALLFVFPPTMKLGAIGLLVTIAIAFSMHAFLGQFRGDLLLYATAVVFIVVHGPLTGPQWRAMLARTPL